jgi:hypothetical protein
MTERKEMTEGDLEAFFRAAHDTAPEPDEAFLARVTADAAGVRREGRVRQTSPLRQVFEAIGRWRGAGGLVAAGLAGLWIGLAPPAPISDPVRTIWGAETGADLLDEALVASLASLEEN